MPTHYCEDQDNVTVSQSEAREHNIKPKENENSFYPILPLSSKLDLDLNDDFHRACRDGYLEKVQEFIRRGASLNSRATATTLKSSDYTPLMRASVRGHSEVVMTLIDEGADIEAKDPNGFTALMLASRVGRTETVAILVDAGAKLEETVHYYVFVSEEATAYMLAKDRGHTKVVDILLSVGAIVRDCERKPRETKPEPLPWETNCEDRKSNRSSDIYQYDDTIENYCNSVQPRWCVLSPPIVFPPRHKVTKKFSCGAACGAADREELDMNPLPSRTQNFRPGVFCFTQPNVSQFIPVHQPPAYDVLTDSQLNKSKKWFEEMWITLSRTKNLFWKDQQCTGFEEKSLTMSMRPISTRNFYMDIKRHGLSPLHFTLCEFVGMRRGSFPPLDFVTRIVSSKFWMLEADKWVDLLIICRWANPIIYTIKTKDVICWICGNEWVEPGNTSCGHTFCTDCLHGKFENGCMKCPLASCQAVVDDKVYPNESAKVLLIRYREERQTSEKRPSEYIPVKAGKRKREVDLCPHSIKKQCVSACGAACGIASPSQKQNSEPDFNTIFETLYPARLKWYEIGLSLGIHYRELNVIKKESIGDCSVCLRETLIILFETETPTVNDFVKALENKTVNHKEVAKKLKEHPL